MADQPIDFVALFGEELVTKDGTKSTKDVLAGKKAVLIYFSAHWCPPCRGFTPVLAKSYSEYTEGDVEVVFVSSDRDQISFDEYYGSMPWAALPYSNRAQKDSVSGRYGVRGIPTLVVLKPDGSLVTESGRGDVHGSDGLAECLKKWGL